MSVPALCSAQFSSEILTRDDGQHWPSSVCLSPPGTLVACRSTASARARLILSSAAASRADPAESPFSSLRSSSGMLRCELADSLASSQIPAPGTTFAETPLFGVLLCVGRSSLPLFSINTSPGGRGIISTGLSISDLNVECIVAAIRGPWDGSHSEYSVRVPSLRLRGILLTFAERVLIAVPCSATTTVSDEEFNIPTNTPGWNRGSHFPPLVGLAGMYRIFSPNSRMGVLSLRPCSLCSGVFPVAADVTPVCQVRSKLHQPAKYP